MARKILLYTHAFGGGGAEIVFARLAAAFAEAGDDVIFAADFADGIGTDCPKLRHIALKQGHAAATRQLAALLRSEKPDASFSALGAQNLKHIAAAILAGRRSRCVLGYHGFAAVEPKRLSQLSYWFSPLTTRLAARTICVSDSLLDNVRQQWHASKRRTVRIYNPVPAARAPSHREEPPLIVGCGRMVAFKRFEDLIEAFSSVHPANARLAILGEGPQRGAIEACIRRHGLENRVELPGHVVDPGAWYARAACVAITSESESFGLTAAEALAHGIPVVSTTCGGPEEILDHGRYGRIVSIGDTEAIAAALTQTIALPGPSAPRIERAKVFALETIRDAYMAVADSLTAGVSR